jgi:hypothetical protein
MMKIREKLTLSLLLAGMLLMTVRTPSSNAASQTDINLAIENGLAYLATVQAADGHWGSAYYVSCTAMAVLSYENAPNNHFSWNLSDPYCTTVQGGLDWLFAHAYTQSIGVQPAGDPDTNGNGFGIYFNDPWGQTVYHTPMVLMAIIASQAPTNVTTTGPAGVIGRTYHDIAVDVVDWLAWAQCDTPGSYRGGWRYTANRGDADNSVSQWPVLGLMAAELWGINAPAFVKSELLNWITATQSLTGTPGTNTYYGAFDYIPGYGWWTIAETSAGIMELTYCGVAKTDPRIIAAQGYINRDWLETSGWRVNLGNFYAMYAVMKACRLATPTPIKFIANYDGTPGVEWYNGTGEYADLLISHQYGDGHWNQWVAPESVPTELSTDWAILILEYVPVVVKYKLTVTVVDANTNTPIPGADVSAEGPESRSDTTDLSGEVEFANLQAGTYDVTASMLGYYSATTNVGVTSDTQITIRLIPIQQVIPEVPWGTIAVLVSMLTALSAYLAIPKLRMRKQTTL